MSDLTPDQVAQINRLWQPRIVEEYYTTVPTPVQQIALCITAREVLFGGAVGGRKV